MGTTREEEGDGVGEWRRGGKCAGIGEVGGRKNIADIPHVSVVFTAGLTLACPLTQLSVLLLLLFILSLFVLIVSCTQVPAMQTRRKTQNKKNKTNLKSNRWFVFAV